jgi:hypothetical protein
VFYSCWKELFKKKVPCCCFFHWVFPHVMHLHSHNSGLDSWTRTFHTHDIAQFAVRCCDLIWWDL